MTDTVTIRRELRSVLRMILNALDRDAAEGKAARGEMAAELRAALAEPVQGEAKPVAAQVRFRRPEKGRPDWSVWQQTTIKPEQPAWSIDSVGYEVEYRLLYTTPPQPAEVGELVEVVGFVAQQDIDWDGDCTLRKLGGKV